MTKTRSAALLAATAVSALLLLPAAPAHAQSEACTAAADAINVSISESGGNLDPDTQQSLSAKLLAIDATGADKDAITTYAHALVDDDISDMNAATAEFNRACAS